MYGFGRLPAESATGARGDAGGGASGRAAATQVLKEVQENLIVFVTEREAPFTHNESKHSPRTGVIRHKVTNGQRSKWTRGLVRRCAFRNRHRCIERPVPL